MEPKTEDTWSFPYESGDLSATIRSDVPEERELKIPPDGLTVGEVLGQGGMGIVSLGAQGRLRRDVAVKQLRPGVPARVSQTLLREAWVTGALEHPNIVPVHDLLEDEAGQPQIVLKRIEGTEWEAFLTGEVALPEEAVEDPLGWHLRILMQVCNAIEYAHRQGVVHRDLKPENVMIGAFGEVYVLDWGIAMGLRPDPRGRFPLASDQKAMVGTPMYMAPEMFKRDASKLGKGTDVYLLTGMLYRVIADRPPRDGLSLQAMASQALRTPPLDPEWPGDLRRLFELDFTRTRSSALGRGVSGGHCSPTSTGVGSIGCARAQSPAWTSSTGCWRAMRVTTTPFESTISWVRCGSGWTRSSRVGRTMPRRPPCSRSSIRRWPDTSCSTGALRRRRRGYSASSPRPTPW